MINKKLLVIIYVLAILCIHALGVGESFNYSVKSNFTEIFYNDDQELKKFSDRLHIDFVVKEFNLISKYDRNCPYKVCKKIDNLVLRVEQILDMHPVRFHVKIKIFTNKKALSQMYIKIFGVSGQKPVAFYVHSLETIFVRLDKLNEHILAHEMGHAVINHNFVIKPSMKMQEILCHYVDAHLKSGY